MKQKDLKGCSSEQLLSELQNYFSQRDWDSVSVVLDLLGFKSHIEGDNGYVWGFAAAVIEVYG